MSMCFLVTQYHEQFEINGSMNIYMFSAYSSVLRVCIDFTLWTGSNIRNKNELGKYTR